jgi:hypothetical protein
MNLLPPVNLLIFLVLYLLILGFGVKRGQSWGKKMIGEQPSWGKKKRIFTFGVKLMCRFSFTPRRLVFLWISFSFTTGR